MLMIAPKIKIEIYSVKVPSQKFIGTERSKSKENTAEIISSFK